MSLQNLIDVPQKSYVKPGKVVSAGSPTLSLIPTRASTPENYPLVEKNNHENYSDKDSTVDSLTPSARTSSSSNSMTSVDFPEGNSFVIDVCPKKKRFVNPEERRLFVEDYKRKYKTEMCKNYEMRGFCKFGDKCCFAHGRHELKAKVLTHIKYKTKPCKQYHQSGHCSYGQRCQYLHKEAVTPNVFCDPAEGPNKFNPQIYDILYEVNRLCSTDCDLKTVLDKMPKRSRLGVFQTLCVA
jgi:hypothetical protein